MTSAIEPVDARAVARAVFHRVVVGIDGSPEGREAARQAAILAGAHGAVVLVAAWTATPLVVGSPAGHAVVSTDDNSARTAAENALARSRFELQGPAPVQAKLVQGASSDVLVREALAGDASLIAVGSHRRGRIEGIILGSTATEIVHTAPCSVLVARRASGRFPSRIVVGVDGSAGSADAYAVARELARESGAELLPILAAGAKGVDRLAVVALVGHRFETSLGKPVDALVAAVAEDDLLVVGSRGLHGVRSLGSVSERVSHRARCSTLIVRPRPTVPGRNPERS